MNVPLKPERSWKFSSAKNLLVVVGGTLAILCLTVPAHALQIVTPADNALLETSRHLIVKAGEDSTVDGIAVEINGVKSEIIPISSPDYRKAFRDFLILQADFDPGENRVVVEGYAGSKRVAEARAQVYLRSEYVSPPSRYREQPFHTAEREALCQGCHHRLNPSAKELNETTPGKHPCYSCHADLINRKHVHGPAGVFECTSCHDAGSKPAKYAVADRDGFFCLDCHQDKYDEYRSAKRVHGPVEAKQCLVCHDPHASDSFAQVRGSINASCLRCHEPVLSAAHVVRGFSNEKHPLEGPVNPWEPRKPLNCASCHEPHGAELTALLRGKSTSNVVFCRRCHNK